MHHERRVNMTERKLKTISFYQEDAEDLKSLSKMMKMSESAVIRYLIQEAKKNETLRNLIIKAETDEAIEKFIKKRTAGSVPIRFNTYVGTKKAASEDTADHQKNYKPDTKDYQEPVSNEEIDEMLADLYGITVEEEKRLHAAEMEEMKNERSNSQTQR